MPSPPTPRIQIALPSKSGAIGKGNNNNNDDAESHEHELDYASPVSSKTPISSSSQQHQTTSSPPSSTLWNSLHSQSLEFKINVECTSICVSPSGNFLWGGFSDGTLRVFDMHGGFGLKRDPIQASRQKSHMLVASKWHQRFGAVACQIHARGVHTDLLTHVEIAGSYVFAGVQRGAMELYAVSLQELEDEAAASSSGSAVAVVGSSSSSSSSHLHKRRRKRNNILDYLNDVHVHSDAKLKGFGACALLNHQNQNRRPTYLLLTGKGIKNIHIWRFQPPIGKEPAVWEQIYDTQTNGTSINVLAFYRSPLGRLLGISKSDAQNLRLWDLTDEEDETEEPIPEGGSCEKKSRPKRPSYQDVVNSKEALGIAGGFCVCGGPTMYNQLSIVSLDQPKNAFNHTELALPGLGGVSRRQRRGDLKQVVRVATLDDSHALLELDDGSMVHYMGCSESKELPKLTLVSEASTGIPALPAEFWRRTLCLAKISGIVVAAVSMYNPNTQKGQVVVRTLSKQQLSSSPIAADAQALQHLCMGVPSSSMVTPKRVLLQEEEELSRRPVAVEDGRKRKKKKRTAKIPLSRNATTVAVSVEKSKSSSKLLPSSFETTPRTNVDASMGHELEKSTQVACVSEIKTVQKKSNSTPEGRSGGKTRKRPKLVPVSTEKSGSSIDKKHRVKNDKQPKQQTSTSADSVSISMTSSHEEKHRSSYKKPSKNIPMSVEKLKLREEDNLRHQETLAQVSPEQRGSPPTPMEPTAVKGAITPITRVLHQTSDARSEKHQIKSSSIARKKQKNAKVEVTEGGAANARLYDASSNIGEKFVAVRKKVIKLKKRDSKYVDGDKANKENKAFTNVRDAKSLSSKDRLVREPLSTRDNDENPTQKQRKQKEDKCIKKTGPTTINVTPTKTDSKANTVADIANMLCDLKSSPASGQTKVRTLAVKIGAATDSKATPSRSRGAPLSREEAMAEKIYCQYKQLQMHLNSLPGNSNKMNPRIQESLQQPKQGPSHERARAKLASQHQAAHEMIQRRLLRATERTMRLLVDSFISIEEARADLKATIQSHEEILYDTLQRQELEASTLASQQTSALHGKEAPMTKLSFPFKAAFQIVEDIYEAIEPPRRLPGRPRAMGAAMLK